MAYQASIAASTATAGRIRQLSMSPRTLHASSRSTTGAMKHPGHANANAALYHSMSSSQPPTPILPPKRILFLRHGQAAHNPRAEKARESGCSFDEFLDLMQQDDAYDAELTSLGERQAKDAGLEGIFEKNRLALGSVDMVVSSPLSRALRTADLVHSARTTSSPSPRRICVENFREINGKLLNAQRRPRKELETLFPHWDFSHIPATDETWTEELETRRDCSERGYRGLLWVMQQKEDNILLVCHGGLLNYMMNDHPKVVLVDGRRSEEDDLTRPVGERFGNCELREFIVSVWECNEVSGCDKFAAQFRNACEKNFFGDVLMNGRKHSQPPIITLEEVSLGESINVDNRAVVDDSAEVIM